MPLYEYHCPTCDLTFEMLTALSDASKKKSCPECGRRAPRVVSAFAIASSGNGHHAAETTSAVTQPLDPRPACMRYPQVPLSCHMDEPSLRRFVAHAQGRGNEHDDTLAKQAETRKQRGIPDPPVAKPAHGHDHSHNLRRHAVTPGQDHSHKNGQAHEHGQGHTKKQAHSHGPSTHTH